MAVINCFPIEVALIGLNHQRELDLTCLYGASSSVLPLLHPPAYGMRRAVMEYTAQVRPA